MKRQPITICKPTAQIIPFPRIRPASARRKPVHELTFGDDMAAFLDSIPNMDRKRAALLGCYRLIKAAKDAHS